MDKYYSLHANCSSSQVEKVYTDQDNSASTSHQGRFRISRVISGLFHMSDTFNWIMDTIFPRKELQIASFYLNYRIKFSHNASEHISHVRAVLSLLRNSRVILSLWKRIVFNKITNYLKRAIRPETLKMIIYTTDTVESLIHLVV